MSGRANALRMQVETALAGRVASPFEYRERRVETVPAGVPEIDRLTGGLPRGALTEICGPAASGRTSVLMAAMAARMAAREVCALVDARDAFDPHSAAEAGVRLEKLLWVRCRNVDQALRAADLLIQGGGFGLIALDLGDTPARVARAIPLPVWFRMRRAVENTPTILVALELDSNAKTCASLVLRMEAREARWTETSGMVCGDGFDEDFAPSNEEKIPTLTNRAWSTRTHKGFEGKIPPPPRRASSKTEDGAPQNSEPTLVTLAWTESGAQERDGRIVLPYAQGCLFEGARNYAEVIRSRAKREGDRLTWREETTEGTEFETSIR
jgi:recombination protein RecA